jgi:hypothetical protein
VRIAYFILAHHAPQQLLRLVGRLRGPEAHLVLHIDANTGGSEWDRLERDLRGPDISRAKRVACRWGDFSLVEATLNCIDTIHNLNTEFDYVILLSGQDYPIKPAPYISRYLAERHGQCLMFIYPFPYPYWVHGGYNRLPTWRIPFRGKRRRVLPPLLFGFPHKRLPLGYRPFGGSQWWCLPGSAVRYVHEFVQSHPEFVSYYRQALMPDEMFFHTILGNSHFTIELGPNNITYMEWGGGGPSPALLTSAHLSELARCDHPFARKFDMNAHPDVLDYIDRELIGVDPHIRVASARLSR